MFKQFISDQNWLRGSGIENFSIGKTTLNRNTTAFIVGKNAKKRILVHSGIHSREWITCFLVLDLVEHYKSIEESLDFQILFVPCANPDGFALCLDGLKSVSNLKLAYELENINGSRNFSQWKANANAVDLNVNFDANWGTGLQNVRYKSSENYIGLKPESEVETKNLVNVTKWFDPQLTISYHSKGEEIYYEFYEGVEEKVRNKQIADRASAITGYRVASVLGSAGGYKDYCISKLKIPALTIEVGKNKLAHPIGLEHLPTIYRQNEQLIFELAKLL